MGLGSLWSLRVLVGERAVMKMRSLMSEEGRLLVMLWWRSVRVNWLMNVVSEGHVHEENSWYHVKGGGVKLLGGERGVVRLRVSRARLLIALFDIFVVVASDHATVYKGVVCGSGDVITMPKVGVRVC